MILTKNELYDPKSKMWLDIVGKIDKNPAHGETLLTVLVMY